MESLKVIQQQVQLAKELSGRINDAIQIVAVTKNQPIDKIKCVLENNILALGENRVQDAQKNFPQLANFVFEKHLIGSLQSNKENNALKIFDTIQSIESLEQLIRITKKIQKHKLCKNIFIQINTSGEITKHGVQNKKELFSMIEYALSMHNYINLQGLMTIGALSSEEKIVRKSFQKLATIREEIYQQFRELSSLKLSMGMSNDFEWAIEEGSDIIRIGRKLFQS